MSDGKKEILRRVRNALSGIPEEESPDDVPVDRSYHQQGGLSGDKLVNLFAKRVGEYKAYVHKAGSDPIKEIVARSCEKQQAGTMVVPQGFPTRWLPKAIKFLEDTPQQMLTNDQLDSADGVITTCALAVAQTGTIILNAGPGQGRRALTLLPDYHFCIVRESQIVELVPEAFAHFEDQIKREAPPITMISGPSATSDIELNRVEGVHGPRNLEVLIVAD